MSAAVEAWRVPLTLVGRVVLMTGDKYSGTALARTETSTLAIIRSALVPDLSNRSRFSLYFRGFDWSGIAMLSAAGSFAGR